MHKAEVIVVGQKIADGPPSEALNPDYAQAEWIEIGIIEVLKGSPQQSSLKVNSWDGMCPYGIVVDEKTYVFFLVKRQVNDEEYEYDAVNFGCGHKTLVVNNDSVNFQGQAVALQDFVKILHTDTPHQ